MSGRGDWKKTILLAGVSPDARQLCVRLAELHQQLIENQRQLLEGNPKEYYLQVFPYFGDPRTEDGSMMIALMELLAEVKNSHG